MEVEAHLLIVMKILIIIGVVLVGLEVDFLVLSVIVLMVNQAEAIYLLQEIKQIQVLDTWVIIL